jgi:hypothetical protein
MVLMEIYRPVRRSALLKAVTEIFTKVRVGVTPKIILHGQTGKKPK